MPYQHDFWVLPSAEFDPYSFWQEPERLPAKVQLTGALVNYIMDSLDWIPSYNPLRREEEAGLCLLGPTVIQAEGCAVAVQILGAWATLLSAGPEWLDLSERMPWSPKCGYPPPTTFMLNRDKAVTSLRALKVLAEQVCAPGAEAFLAHQVVPPSTGTSTRKLAQDRSFES